MGLMKKSQDLQETQNWYDLELKGHTHHSGPPAGGVTSNTPKTASGICI